MSDPTHGPWWLEPTVTGVSIVVGAFMIMWQQRASNRSGLKLKLFDELRETLQTAANALTTAGMYAFGAPGHLKIYHDMLARGYRAAVPQDRIPSFNEVHFAALAQITSLVILLESYDIVSEHFELFRRALSCAHGDVQQAHARLTPVLYKTFPVDVPDRPEPFVPAATHTDLEELGACCNAYWTATSTAVCYIQDIKIEAQNLLLRGLFRRRVPARKPPDTSLWVLRSDDRKYLRRVREYFFQGHPVAAQHRQLEAEAAARSAAEAGNRK